MLRNGRWWELPAGEEDLAGPGFQRLELPRQASRSCGCGGREGRAALWGPGEAWGLGGAQIALPGTSAPTWLQTVGRSGEGGTAPLTRLAWPAGSYSICGESPAA